MKRWQLIAAAVFLVLAITPFFIASRHVDKPILLNPPAEGTTRVQFSDGRIELYSADQLANLKWIAIKPKPYNPSFSKKLNLLFARFAGMRKFPVSDPPKLVGVDSHLRACSQYTRQTFYLHEHFAENMGQISFFFGGPKYARTPAEWIEANLNSIRTNRIAVGPKGSRDFVSCAVLISQDSIRIIPESLLLNHYAQSSPNQ